MPSKVSLAKRWNPVGVSTDACMIPSTSILNSRNVDFRASPPSAAAEVDRAEHVPGKVM